MTRYIDVSNVQELVSRLGAATMMSEMAGFIREDFLRWEQFQKSARTANHSEVGVIELMPTSDDQHYAFKYVNGHPQNPTQGLSTVMAFGVLAEVATGLPLLLSELTVTTAMRTAATSAMAAQALARPDCRSMALIGNGAQSEFQALAFKAIVGVTHLRLYDLDPAATERCARNLEGKGLSITACGSSQEAIEGADIVTTVTADKQYATILSDNMVGPGVHINAVGGDCPGKTELHGDILLRSDIYVEYPPQTRIEGEIQQLDPDYPVKELWQVMTGQIAGRANDRAITLFDSVGFAIEDFSALRYVLKQLRSLPKSLSFSDARAFQSKRVYSARTCTRSSPGTSRNGDTPAVNASLLNPTGSENRRWAPTATVSL